MSILKMVQINSYSQVHKYWDIDNCPITFGPLKSGRHI